MTRGNEIVSANLSLVHLLMVLFLLCYLSFWYSSLKIFKVTQNLNRKQRVFFKLLTVCLWNYSLITLGFLSQDIWGETKKAFLGPELLIVFPMLLAALGLFWYAREIIRSVHFDVIFSQKTPQALVKEGPYRYIRHPFYASYVTVYLGLIILNYNWIVSLLSLVLILDYFFAAKSEEKKFLNSPFAEEYNAYKAKTKMFFPFLF